MTDFNQKTHDTDVGSHGGQSRQMMEVFENQEFGSIRVLQEAGKTFFCASDVAKALGYVNPYAAVKRHCRDPLTKREGVVQKVNQYGDAGEQVVEISFINGGGNAVLGTSYTAEDEDLKGVETDYTKAEKYLGYPYVWGGSSPSTSFDCSGFVSWVINHCGNGWNVGRQTANGLMGKCDIIPKSEAKPGDLIFFQKTYNTSGASHVGIYVGNGMMIHCGNPISYASIETSYWRQHYYCMGRIR